MKALFTLLVISLYVNSFATYMPLARIWDGGNDTARVDSVSQSMQVVDYEHHEIHNGNHYVFSFDTTLGNGETLLVTIRPDTMVYPHVLFNITTKEPTLLRIFNSCAYKTIDTGYSALPYCNNRVIDKGVNTKFRIGGRSTDTTLVFRQYLTTDQGIGGEIRESNEFILRPLKYYGIKLVSGAVSNIVNIRIYFYEE